MYEFGTLDQYWVTVFMPMFAMVTWSASLPVFVAIFSCAMRTFSDPLMMKYPPGSSGHSFNSVKVVQKPVCGPKHDGYFADEGFLVLCLNWVLPFLYDSLCNVDIK